MNSYPEGAPIRLTVTFTDKTQTPAVPYTPSGAISIHYSVNGGAFASISALTASSTGVYYNTTALDSTGSSGVWEYRGVAGPGAGQTASLNSQLLIVAASPT